MVKKISFLSGVSFLVLSLLAPAQTAQTSSGRLNAPALGVLEGMLDYCGKVNPKSADKYKEIGKSLTKDQTAEAVAEMRNSQEYKDSHDQMGKQLEALSTKEGLATCTAKGK